jgi:hypothetical protein
MPDEHNSPFAWLIIKASSSENMKEKQLYLLSKVINFKLDTSPLLKINMMKATFPNVIMTGSVLFMFLFASACNHKGQEYCHYFDKYVYPGDYTSRNSIIQKYKVTGKNEYRFTVMGELNNYWYYEEIDEKVTNNGLERKFDDKFVITHEFDSILKENHFKGLDRQFFLNSVTLSGKKQINIEGKKYLVLRYYETVGTYGYISYYLKDFGFISYMMDTGYLLCRRTYNDNRLNQSTLNLIDNSLISDTAFFIMPSHFRSITGRE